MHVIRLDEGDWVMLRESRLRALADAPSAFWATYADEATHGEREWREFARAAAWFTARRDGAVTGLAAGLIRPEPGAGPELISVWVEPADRQRGTATALIRAVQDWSRDSGADHLTLWVTESNAVAARLYERLGFRFTGERVGLPRDPAVHEARMQAPLTGQARSH